jgi:hypothetical protein
VAAGLLLVVCGIWVITQTLLADPSLLDVLGVT